MRTITPYSLLFLLFICLPSLKAFNILETIQEAENNYTYSGPGAPSIKQRGFASNAQTLWVNQVGGMASWEVMVPATGDYSLIVRYSNDDTGALDDISVRVNGVLVGNFTSINTYIIGTPAGSGWNEFTDSPSISLGQLNAGTVTLSLSLDDDDNFGIEYDKLTITGSNIQAPTAPALVSPGNGTLNVPTNHMLAWTPSVGINTYEVQIDDSPDFSPPFIQQSNLSGSGFSFSGLLEGTLYFWRVRASNGCAESPWSSIWTFTTECLVFAEISPMPPLEICEGENLSLTATGGNTFLWNNGSTSAGTTANAPGIYSVTVSNSINCTAEAEILVEEATVLEPAVLIELDSLSLCGGGPVAFNAIGTNTGDNPSFQWLINGAEVGSNSTELIVNNLNDGDIVQCQMHSSAGCVSLNPASSNTISFSNPSAYYHPFQNFDDDVDRIKTFTNFFGGNSGVVNEDLLELSFDTFETRSNHGRSLKMSYEEMEGFSIYVESFERKWFDINTSLNLKDLFPDFANPIFQNRQIDSVVFYGKLVADQPLVLQVKLEDTNKQGATLERSIQPLPEWQRFAFSLNDFAGDFNPEIAKLMGLNFDQGLGQNQGTSGTFYLDDMYLVESCFEKPVFSNADEMLDYLNEVNFRHFWMAVEPESKFALDRHIWDDLISTDAIGFSLAAYVIAHKNGWVDPVLVENRVEHILTYLVDSCANAIDTNVVANDPLAYASVRGIWAHFLDNKTLSRKDEQTEFSLFSTALLLGGVITASEYFQNNPNIVELADTLYARADWNFMLRTDSLMNYDWKPETSYSPYYTDWFSEELDLCFLLGIASPNPDHRLDFNPYFIEAYHRPLCPDGEYVYSAPGANFTYYFLQMYARFEEQSQRFQNSKNALLADLDFCQNEYGSLGYDPLIFGTTACEGPDSAGIESIIGTDTTFISNYHAYGNCCKFDEHNTGNGTVAVYGSGSAAIFIPEDVKDLWGYYYTSLDEQFWDDYGYRFWSPIFGMPDAFHLSPDISQDNLVNGLNFRGPWLSVPRFGIDVGPMLMNIDSYLSEEMGEPSIRDYFSNHPPISSNLSQFNEIATTGELKPVVNISLQSGQTVCEGESVVFVASVEHGGDAPLYEWYLDGLLFQTGAQPLFEVSALPGNHSVFCNMISSEHCIEGQAAISSTLSFVVLPANPVGVEVNASDLEACLGDTIVLEALIVNGGANPMYQWSVNGNDTGSSSPLLEWSGTAGEYTVICTVTSSEICATNNPAESAETVVQFHDLPEISFLAIDSFCLAEGPVELNLAVPTGGSYSGDGIDDNIFTPAEAGLGTHPISYHYTAPSTGCSSLADTTIYVNDALPTAVEVFSSTTEICLGDTVFFVAEPMNGGNTPGFEWMVNGSSTGATGPVFEFIGFESGVTEVFCAMTSSEDCVWEPFVTSAPIMLTIFSLPDASAGNDGPACQGSEVTLTAEGGLLYSWEGPNGFSSDSAVVVLSEVAVSDTGTYSVTVTNLEGCTDTASTSLIVYPSPTIDSISSNSPICAGETLEVIGFPDDLIYEWTSPSGQIYSQPSTLILDASVLDSGEWSLLATNVEGCETIEEFFIQVNELPNVSIDSICLSISFDTLPFPLMSCGIPVGGIFTINGMQTDTIFSQMVTSDSLLITYVYEDSNNCSDTVSTMVFISNFVSTTEENAHISQVKIYPNPTTGIFTIEIGEIVEPMGITLHNISGTTMERWEIPPGKERRNVFQLNQQIPPGMYFLVLQNNRSRIIKKIILMGE